MARQSLGVELQHDGQDGMPTRYVQVWLEVPEGSTNYEVYAHVCTKLWGGPDEQRCKVIRGIPFIEG